MKIWKTLFCSLLAAILCLSLVGCNNGGNDPLDSDESTDAKGVTAHGRVEASDFPANTELTDWYARSMVREQLTNAILCSYEESDGLWHCWLYLGAYQKGDAVAFGASQQDGTVYIRHTAADPDASGATGAFYFTVEQADEPTFELYVNGDFVGMIVTLAQGSMKR